MRIFLVNIIHAQTPNLMSCGMRGGSRRGPPQGLPAGFPGAGGGIAGWLEGVGGWRPAGTRASRPPSQAMDGRSAVRGQGAARRRARIRARENRRMDAPSHGGGKLSCPAPLLLV